MTTTNLDLPETKNYFTQVGYSDEAKQQLYQIVNRKHGVIEFETAMFPQVKAVINQLEDMLREEEPTAKVYDMTRLQ